VEWASIVEFFTKRGRPLSKDEINKLVEEDRKDREKEAA
jgi:RNA:NAD 2'-phosphotransferase (TPT1/KptA family)